MHRIEIPSAAIEQVMQRRGNLHCIETLEPARTALLVVDLQNGFMMPGYPLEVPVARAIVPNVNRLATAMREAGGTVVWIRMNIESELGHWDSFFSRMNAKAADGAVATLSPGSDGYRLHADLDVRDADVVVDKKRFSAFIQGSSDLDAQLRARGIDTLVVTGTLTNVCCESTARDAMMLNYTVAFVSDANATLTDEAHNATLATMLTTFGDVFTTEEIITLLCR